MPTGAGLWETRSEALHNLQGRPMHAMAGAGGGLLAAADDFAGCVFLHGRHDSVLSGV